MSLKPKMRALSIRQPFAELIMTGEKNIEYRSRPVNLRERVCIYACKSPSSQDAYEDCGLSPEELPHGFLVGTVEIVECTGNYDDYEWRESQDPCTNSYFYNTKIATNVLASDLGVIAKRGENKSYFFAVNNLLTTEPVCGAKIDLYSYQQQKLGTANTDASGTAYFKLDKFAYFASSVDAKINCVIRHSGKSIVP